MKHKHLITRFLDLTTGLYDTVFLPEPLELRIHTQLIVSADLRGNETILDIGCGTGKLDLRLARILRKGSIYGIDIASNMIKIAKRNSRRAGLKINYRVGSATELPYNGDMFDVVFTSLIFHHMDYEEKRVTLLEIHRVLKRNGKYISVEFNEFPHRLITKFMRDSGILHGLYPVKLIEQAGLHIVQETKGPSLGGHHPTFYRVSRKEE